MLPDKTQAFHEQIELKQKELQPWTAKINAKQAEVDVAVSERDTLVKKVEAVKSARKEAQDALDGLRADFEGKVRFPAIIHSMCNSDCLAGTREVRFVSRQE